MKKFIQLQISHPERQRLIDLLNAIKQHNSTAFKLARQETENYAKAIFKDVNEVACFKSERKSLFECKVWLYIGTEELVVANITSEMNNNLGVVNYNVILNTFFHEMVSPYIRGYNCSMTGEDVAMSGILQEEVYRKLNAWQATCNKSMPIAHPADYERWLDFVVSYFINHDQEITPDDLEQWLIEDCHWPQAYIDEINKMAIKFEYSIDLLKKEHEHQV